MRRCSAGTPNPNDVLATGVREASGVQSLKIRPAHTEDLDDVVACVDAAYQGYIEDIGQKPAPMLDDYGSLIRADAVTVATIDGELTGLIVMWARPDHWYVDNVAVWPDRQSTGVGSILLAHAEQLAEAAGFGEIRLYTNEAMTANTTYYERRGYVETHRSVEAGYNRIHYSRTL